MNNSTATSDWPTIFRRLKDRLVQSEKSRSQYWEEESAKFEIADDGTVSGLNSMGTVSTKRTPFYMSAAWFLLIPFRMMGWRFRRFGMHLNNGYKIAKRQGRLFTHDMLRQVLVIALIDHYTPLDKQEGATLVIGDGYGVLTSLFLAANPNGKIITCNLDKSLLLDLLQIRTATSDINIALACTEDELQAAIADNTIQLIGVPADEADILRTADLGIVTNVHSMMEMEHAVIANYFDIIRDNKSDGTFFYCANRLYKKLQGGSITRFLEYPWKPEDEILHDSVSQWSQWNVSRTPPFLHYRFGEHRVVWHRLARMKMDKA